jgi:NitT/TauT family transport system substrate-binding protein
VEAKKKLGISAGIIVAVIISSYFGDLASTITNGGTTNNNNENMKSNLLRVGYFPNINHAQAIIGLGSGDFQKALGPDVKVEQLYLMLDLRL